MSERAWRPRVVDVVALLGFFTLWLVPMAVVGYLGGAPASWATQARDLYSVSCLFGTGSERVSVFYVQVRRAGRLGWEDFDEGEYFRLEPFGHRSRFDRFMSRFGYHEDAEDARVELARWLTAVDRRDHEDRPPITAVRFLWADVVIDPERPPTGRWRKPPRAEIGPLRRLGDIVFIDPNASAGPERQR